MSDIVKTAIVLRTAKLWMNYGTDICLGIVIQLVGTLHTYG